MLWFSAPTSLDHELLSDGVILEKYNEAVHLAGFHSASLEDEHPNIFFVEVNTCSPGDARENLESGKGNGLLETGVKGLICCF